MFIDTLNRLVYKEGKLIEQAPPRIPEGISIKIEWDGGLTIHEPTRSYFEKGGDDFIVSRTISTNYAVSVKSDDITINGETREKWKEYKSYIFAVNFENKEPLYWLDFEIKYYPEMFQMGKTLDCLSIECLRERHKILFENLKISCPDIKMIRCKQKLALSMLLNERLSEDSPIKTNLDIITLISKCIEYYPEWKSWEEVDAAGYYDDDFEGAGGGGGKKKKRKSKRKKRKTKRRKSKRKKHKTKRRKS